MRSGGARPDRDYPRLIADMRSGRINVRDQVSAVWPIDRIDEAIAALTGGEVTRGPRPRPIDGVRKASGAFDANL